LHSFAFTGPGEVDAFEVLGIAVDVGVCGHNHCVYVSDTSLKFIHRLALSGGKTTHWPVSLKDRPACLSLVVKHSLLVTRRYASKIKEFTTHGQSLHKFVLPQEVCLPWHSDQLFSGLLLVCHGFVFHEEILHRVCLMGSDGKVVKSYGGPQGSGMEQMDTPSKMAIDENENVFCCRSKQRQNIVTVTNVSVHAQNRVTRTTSMTSL